MRRFEVADRLGLAGPRRAALTELGTLVMDDGHAEIARIDRVRAVLGRIPGARENVEAVALFDAALHARGEIVTVVRPSADAVAHLFGADIASPPIDPDVAAIARPLAAVAVRRALEAEGRSGQDAAADAEILRAVE